MSVYSILVYYYTIVRGYLPFTFQYLKSTDIFPL